MTKVFAVIAGTDDGRLLCEREKDRRKQALTKFVDPACTDVESKNTHLRVSSETEESLRELHLHARLALCPNLPSAFRRETLLHLIEQHRSTIDVLQLLSRAAETRSLWRAEAVSYSFNRICSKYTVGCIRQQGWEKEGRPIVWILRALEKWEWRTAFSQEEFARSLMWAVDVAIRRRPQGVHGVVIYVLDQPGTGALSFGKTFASLFCRQQLALLGLLDSICFFNPTLSSVVLKNLLRHFSQRKLSMKSVFQQMHPSMWRDWVTDVRDVPLEKATDVDYSDAKGLCAPLQEALKSHFGFSPPLSLEDVFNTNPKEVERRYSLQRSNADASIISTPGSLERDSDRVRTTDQRGLPRSPVVLSVSEMRALDCAHEWNASPNNICANSGSTVDSRSGWSLDVIDEILSSSADEEE